GARAAIATDDPRTQVLQQRSVGSLATAQVEDRGAGVLPQQLRADRTHEHRSMRTEPHGVFHLSKKRWPGHLVVSASLGMCEFNSCSLDDAPMGADWCNSAAARVTGTAAVNLQPLRGDHPVDRCAECAFDINNP